MAEYIDPAGDPFLGGVLAPVDDEFDVADLPVIGKIPGVGTVAAEIGKAGFERIVFCCFSGEAAAHHVEALDALRLA